MTGKHTAAALAKMRAAQNEKEPTMAEIEASIAEMQATCPGRSNENYPSIRDGRRLKSGPRLGRAGERR